MQSFGDGEIDDSRMNDFGPKHSTPVKSRNYMQQLFSNCEPPSVLHTTNKSVSRTPPSKHTQQNSSQSRIFEYANNSDNGLSSPDNSPSIKISQQSSYQESKAGNAASYEVYRSHSVPTSYNTAKNKCNSNTDKDKSQMSQEKQNGTWYLSPNSKLGYAGDGNGMTNTISSVLSDAIAWSPVSTAAFLEQDIINKQRHEIQILMEELGTRDQELNDLVSSHQKQVQAWEAERDKYMSLQLRLRNYEDELMKNDKHLKETLKEMALVSEQREADAQEFKRTQDEMEKLAERISENSHYIKEMEFQNKSLKNTIKELMSDQSHREKRQQELMRLIEDNEKLLSEKKSELNQLKDHIKFIESRCDELEEKNMNLSTESSNWKKKYCQAKDEADKLLVVNSEKEEANQKITLQLQESLQQAVALQKALFTSCEREKCKEEVMYSLRKQHKRTMQELQNIRELYDRQNRDLTLYHLSVKERNDRESVRKETEQKQRHEHEDKDAGGKEIKQFKRDKNMSSHKDRISSSTQESEESVSYLIKHKQSKGGASQECESESGSCQMETCPRSTHTTRCYNVATTTSSTTQLSEDRDSSVSRSRPSTSLGLSKTSTWGTSSGQNSSRLSGSRCTRSCSDPRSSSVRKRVTRSRTTSPILTRYAIQIRDKKQAGARLRGKPKNLRDSKVEESSSPGSHLLSPLQYDDGLSPADSDGMCHELKRDITKICVEAFDVSSHSEKSKLSLGAKPSSLKQLPSAIPNPHRSSFLKKERVEKRISFTAGDADDNEESATTGHSSTKKSVEFSTKLDKANRESINSESFIVSPVAAGNECSHNSPLVIESCNEKVKPSRCLTMKHGYQTKKFSPKSGACKWISKERKPCHHKTEKSSGCSWKSQKSPSENCDSYESSPPCQKISRIDQPFCKNKQEEVKPPIRDAKPPSQKCNKPQEQTTSKHRPNPYHKTREHIEEKNQSTNGNPHPPLNSKKKKLKRPQSDPDQSNKKSPEPDVNKSISQDDKPPYYPETGPPPEPSPPEPRTSSRKSFLEAYQPSFHGLRRSIIDFIYPSAEDDDRKTSSEKKDMLGKDRKSEIYQEPTDSDNEPSASQYQEEQYEDDSRYSEKKSSSIIERSFINEHRSTVSKKNQSSTKEHMPSRQHSTSRDERPTIQNSTSREERFSIQYSASTEERPTIQHPTSREERSSIQYSASKEERPTTQYSASREERPTTQHSASRDERSSIQYSASREERPTMQHSASRDERSSIQYSASREERPTMQHSTSRDERPTMQHSASRDERSSIQYSASREERPTMQHSTSREERPTMQHSTSSDERPTMQHSASRDERSSIQYSASREERPTMQHSTSRDERPTILHSASREERSSIQYSSSREEKPSIQHTTSREERPTIQHSTSRDERPTILHSASRDERSSIPYSASREERPTMQHSTSRDERPTILHSASREERSSIQYSSSREEKPSIQHTTSREERPTIQHSTSRVERPTIEHSTSREERPTIQHSTSREERPTMQHSTSREERPTVQHSTPREERSSIQYSSSRDERPSIQHSDSREDGPSILHSDSKEERPNTQHSTSREERPTIQHSTSREDRPSLHHSTREERPTIQHSISREERLSIQHSTSREHRPSTQHSSYREQKSSIQHSTSREERPITRHSTIREERPSIQQSTPREERLSLQLSPTNEQRVSNSRTVTSPAALSSSDSKLSHTEKRSKDVIGDRRNSSDKGSYRERRDSDRKSSSTRHFEEDTIFNMDGDSKGDGVLFSDQRQAHKSDSSVLDRRDSLQNKKPSTLENKPTSRDSNTSPFVMVSPSASRKLSKNRNSEAMVSRHSNRSGSGGLTADSASNFLESVRKTPTKNSSTMTPKLVLSVKDDIFDVPENVKVSKVLSSNDRSLEITAELKRGSSHITPESPEKLPYSNKSVEAIPSRMSRAVSCDVCDCSKNVESTRRFSFSNKSVEAIPSKMSRGVSYDEFDEPKEFTRRSSARNCVCTSQEEESPRCNVVYLKCQSPKNAQSLKISANATGSPVVEISPVPVMDCPPCKEKSKCRDSPPFSGFFLKKNKKMKITVQYSDDEYKESSDESDPDETLSSIDDYITERPCSGCKKKQSKPCKCRLTHQLREKPELFKHHGIYTCKDNTVIPERNSGYRSVGKTSPTREDDFSYQSILQRTLKESSMYGHRKSNMLSSPHDKDFLESGVGLPSYKYKGPRVDPFLGQPVYNSKVGSGHLPADVGVYLSQHRRLYCNNNRSQDSQSDNGSDTALDSGQKVDKLDMDTDLGRKLNAEKHFDSPQQSSVILIDHSNLIEQEPCEEISPNEQRDYFYTESIGSDCSVNKDGKVDEIKPEPSLAADLPAKPFTTIRGQSLYQQLAQIHFCEKSRRYEWVNGINRNIYGYIKLLSAPKQPVSTDTKTAFENVEKLNCELLTAPDKSLDSGHHSTSDGCQDDLDINCANNNNSNEKCGHKSETNFSTGSLSLADQPVVSRVFPGTKTGGSSDRFRKQFVPDPIVRKLNFDDTSLLRSELASPQANTRLKSNELQEKLYDAEDQNERKTFFMFDFMAPKDNTPLLQNPHDHLTVEICPCASLDKKNVNSSEMSEISHLSLADYFNDISTLSVEPEEDNAAVSTALDIGTSHKNMAHLTSHFEEETDDGVICNQRELLKKFTVNFENILQHCSREELHWFENKKNCGSWSKNWTQGITENSGQFVFHKWPEIYGEILDHLYKNSENVSFSDKNDFRSSDSAKHLFIDVDKLTAMDTLQLDMNNDIKTFNSVETNDPSENFFQCSRHSADPKILPKYSFSTLQICRAASSSESNASKEVCIKIPDWLDEEIKDSPENLFDKKVPTFLQNISDTFSHLDVDGKTHMSPSTRLHKLLIESQEMIHLLEHSSAIPEAVKLKVSMSYNH